MCKTCASDGQLINLAAWAAGGATGAWAGRAVETISSVMA